MTLTIATKQTEKDIYDKKDAASRRIPVNRIAI